MFYSLTGISAILVIFVVNFNTFFMPKKNIRNKSTHNSYVIFLISLLVFCVVDVLYGVFIYCNLKTAASIDTSIYFLAMSLTILAWTKFEISYLKENKTFEIVLKVVGWLMLIAGVSLIITNFFTPILFDFDESAGYHPHPARYAYLTVQIALYLLNSIYALLVAFRSEKGEERTKHLTVAAFGAIMATAIFIQIFLPDYPIYAIGCLVGDCLVYSFVVRLETDIFRRQIKEGKYREVKKQEELESAKELAYTDPLTGVKNKHAYVEKELEVDLLIREGKMEKFAIIVFDLNDLKLVNDTYGHDVGDKYIINACNLIAKHFKYEDIYRYGGDEFVVILQGESFSTRNRLLEKFNDQIEKNIGSSDEPIVATGLSDFNPHKDNTLRAVFIRADEKMYIRKRSLKEMNHVRQWN